MSDAAAATGRPGVRPGLPRDPVAGLRQVPAAALDGGERGSSAAVRPRSGPRTRTGQDRGPGHRDGRVRSGDHRGPHGCGDIERLVRRAQSGDAEAFGQIYDRYLDTVFRYVYFRVRSRVLAEDLTQEAFLRALRRIHGFTWQGRDLGAWLVTIARNLVADHFKSSRYRLETPTPEVLGVHTVDPGPEGRPEAAVVDKDTSRTLLDAVNRLGSEQRECIVLRFLHGFSVAETAQVMGKNAGAVKALQYRAVRSLARLLPDGFTR